MSEVVFAVVLDQSIEDVPASGVANGRASAIEAQKRASVAENFMMIVEFDE